MSVLSATSVSVNISGKQILQPTSLALETGALTAIVGPNGAGKSTLLRALLQLQQHGGEVTLDGAPINKIKPAARARALSYLPQGQSHAWPLAVQDVVALGRHPHGGGGDEIVETVLERLDLQPLRTRSVLSLSGGEQMRVSLARALAVDAPFLLADEPLASLDPHHQFAILDVLAGDVENGKGVVIVLHDLALAARYADQIVLMEAGSVVAHGPPAEVLTAERVSATFDVETEIVSLSGRAGAFSVALPMALKH